MKKLRLIIGISFLLLIAIIPKDVFAYAKFQCVGTNSTLGIKCTIDVKAKSSGKASISAKCESTSTSSNSIYNISDKTILKRVNERNFRGGTNDGAASCPSLYIGLKPVIPVDPYHPLHDVTISGTSGDEGATSVQFSMQNSSDLDNWPSGNYYTYTQIGEGKDPGCKGIFGDVKDSGHDGQAASIAYILQKIFNYMKILGPMLVIVYSGFDFTKIVLSGDDDAMAKAKQKLIIRLVLIGVLFFIPYFVQFVLGIINGSLEDPTCGIM